MRRRSVWRISSSAKMIDFLRPGGFRRGFPEVVIQSMNGESQRGHRLEMVYISRGQLYVESLDLLVRFSNGGFQFGNLLCSSSQICCTDAYTCCLACSNSSSSSNLYFVFSITANASIFSFLLRIVFSAAAVRSISNSFTCCRLELDSSRDFAFSVAASA